MTRYVFVRYELRPRVERAVRRVIGLPAAPPNRSSRITVPVKGGEFFQLQSRDAADVQADRDRWHHEPRHARLLSSALDRAEDLLLFDPVHEIRDRVQRHVLVPRRRQRAFVAILEARELHWSPWHLGYGGTDTHIDGRLHTPDGTHTIALDLSCFGDEAHWARDALIHGGIMHTQPLHGTPSGGTPRLIVPAAHLGRGMMISALKLWYMQMADEPQGHWAAREGRLPEFVVDEPIVAADDDRARRKELAAIRALNKALRAADRDPYGHARERWARFDVTLEDLLVPEPA